MKHLLAISFSLLFHNCFFMEVGEKQMKYVWHDCWICEMILTGSLGTRRFCSSRDLGNYCEYIRRPGDQREYRSCVYTCTGDGCNGTGLPSQPNVWFLVAASVLSFLIYFRDISSSNVFNLGRMSARGSFMSTPVIR